MSWTDYLGYTPTDLTLRAGNYIARMLTAEPEKPKRETQPTKKVPKPVPVTTRREELKKEAAKKKPSRNFLATIREYTPDSIQAIGSAINQGLPFEAGNRFTAAIADVAGVGEDDDIGWSGARQKQLLDAARASQAQDAKDHPWLYGAGAVIGAIGGGGALSLGVRGVGTALSKAPKLARVGNAIRGSQILRTGETGRNLTKLAASGAALGGAEAAVRGEPLGDVGLSAVTGAVAAPVGAKLADAAGFLFRPAVDFLKKSDPGGRILRRFTTSTTDEVQTARNAYKQANNGAEPTLFELLRPDDVPQIRKVLGRMPGDERQLAVDAIRSRAQNVRPEMASMIAKETQTGRQQISRNLADDLAKSRGATKPTRDEFDLADAASVDKVNIENLRDLEGGNIMRPFNDRPVAENLGELLPQSPVMKNGTPTWQIDASNDVIRALRSAAGAKTKDFTVDDITKISRRLKKRIDANQTDSGDARIALAQLDDFMTANHPDAAEAISRMRAQWSGKKRMVEGLEEGMVSRPGAVAAQKMDQYKYQKAYKTDEGTTGRFVGQSQALQDMFAGTADDAMRTTGRLAEDLSLGRAVADNISSDVSGNLQRAAQMQSDGLRRIASLRGDLKDKIPEADIAAIGNALLTVNPASFPITRLAAAGRLLPHLNLSKGASEKLIGNLFSQDSRQINAAIKLLNNAGRDGRRSLVQMAGALSAADTVGPTAVAYDNAGNAGDASPTINEPDYTKMSDEELMQQIQQGEQSDYSQMSDEELMQQIQQEGDSPYAQELQSVYDSESPEFLDLLARVQKQESGGQHFDTQGRPITSSAGAIGIMQVMPKTAPEAARMAGLPWDENAYYSDPAYNEILGIAYLSEMLRRYDGDVEHALAAYNAGPEAVDKAGGVPAFAETQNYVSSILK